MSFSFVVQGPVISETSENGFATREVLQSIRQHFPGSEIILSTWKNSNVEGLEFDKVILNEDPGAIVSDNFTFNAKRLIVSTVNGIRSCSNDHVVKTRTDVKFSGGEFATTFKAMHEGIKPSRYSLFSKKVLSTNFYVRNPLRLNYGFHGSDIFLVGAKADLLALFDQDPALLEQVAVGQEKGGTDAQRFLKCVAEQYLLSQLLLKKQGTRITFDGDDRPMKMWEFKLSERLLFRNFKFYHPKDLGVVFPDRFYNRAYPGAIYSPSEIKLMDTLLRTPVLGDLFLSFRAVRYLLIHGKLKMRTEQAFKVQLLNRLKWKL